MIYSRIIFKAVVELAHTFQYSSSLLQTPTNRKPYTVIIRISIYRNYCKKYPVCQYVENRIAAKHDNINRHYAHPSPGII